MRVLLLEKVLKVRARKEIELEKLLKITYFATKLGLMASVAKEDGNSGSPVPLSCCAERRTRPGTAVAIASRLRASAASSGAAAELRER